MRRQIFFFHMATLIVALLTLLAVSGGVLHLVFRAYQDQAVPAADSRSDQVQSTLANWPEEARDWWELDQSLAKLDYRLAVEENRQVVYSSLNRFQEDLYNHIFADASWPELGTLALQDQGVLIVGRRCGNAVLVAMMEPQTPEMFGQQRPQNEAALISFSVSGLAAPERSGSHLFLCQRTGGHRNHRRPQLSVYPVPGPSDSQAGERHHSGGWPGGAGRSVHPSGLQGSRRILLGIRRL